MNNSPEIDPYGISKRFNFIKGLIQLWQPKSILDFGCGTGVNLTVPLAEEFKSTNFLGFDADTASVTHASTKSHANLQYESSFDKLKDHIFDLVICSEVLEHVENPIETLNFLRQVTKPNGHCIVTVPNGYGPYEIGMFIESLFTLSGLRGLIKPLKQSNEAVANAGDSKDTLAISPHINFYRFGQITGLIEKSGFEIEKCEGRTFICGFIFDRLIRTRWLSEFNMKLGSSLPSFLVAGWMFVLKPIADNNLPVTATTMPVALYRRPYFDRLRARMNMIRWFGKTHG